MDYTMFIDGVPGELTLAHANGEHAVQDLEFSFLGAQHTPNTHGRITGAPVVDHFAVTLPTSKSMAMLIGKLFTSKHIPTVRITLWTLFNGQIVKAETYTLTEVSLNQFAKVSDKGEGAGCNRTMNFNMRQLKVESFAPDGSATSSMTYDFVRATAA
jgi:type VI protein secretion system component Hcp